MNKINRLGLIVLIILLILGTINAFKFLNRNTEMITLYSNFEQPTSELIVKSEIEISNDLSINKMGDDFPSFKNKAGSRSKYLQVSDVNFPVIKQHADYQVSKEGLINQHSVNKTGSWNREAYGARQHESSAAQYNPGQTNVEKWKPNAVSIDKNIVVESKDKKENGFLAVNTINEDLLTYNRQNAEPGGPGDPGDTGGEPGIPGQPGGVPVGDAGYPFVFLSIAYVIYKYKSNSILAK